MSIRERLEDKCNEVLGEYMDQNGVKTGDVYPMQAFRWDELLDELSDLMETITEQNKHTEEE